VRQGEDQVKVRHRQHFAPSGDDPRFLGSCLATRAMPVAAGPATGTGFDMPPERRRAAGEYGPPDLGRATRQRLCSEIAGPKVASTSAKPAGATGGSGGHQQFKR
jgi:hypothetical protein